MKKLLIKHVLIQGLLLFLYLSPANAVFAIHALMKTFNFDYLGTPVNLGVIVYAALVIVTPIAYYLYCELVDLKKIQKFTIRLAARTEILAIWLLGILMLYKQMNDGSG